MTKLADLKSVTLSNRTILLDVSHVKTVGDEVTQGGIVIGKVTQSEIPTYGYVVAVDPELKGVKVGDLIPIAQAGTLRQFEWPGKPKDHKIVSMRFDMVDGVIEI